MDAKRRISHLQLHGDGRMHRSARRHSLSDIDINGAGHDAEGDLGGRDLIPCPVSFVLAAIVVTFGFRVGSGAAGSHCTLFGDASALV